jgi:uncharacterized membrane-anchored protein
MLRAPVVLVFAVTFFGAGGVALARDPHGTRPPAGKTAHAPAAAPPTAASASDSASGDPASAPSEEDPGAKPKVRFHWKSGPQSIDLGHDISLALPERDSFLGGPEAGQLLEKLGNFHNDNLLGVVVSNDEKATWFVTIRYDEEGYVKDTDAIDADDLLSAIKEGTEEGNKEREAHGFKPLHVSAWSELPRYDKGVHHLVWALRANSDDGESVNFNTRVLGRKGIVSLNLVCDPEDLSSNKPEVATLLQGTGFQRGSRYEEFNSKTDKMAEYGLAGLILGGAGLGAAKLVKIGLLAKFWKVILAALIAGKKAILLGLAGAVAFVKRFFGRKTKTTQATPSTPPSAT